MPAPRVAICAIAKDEGAYLEEWIAYHRLIGFDPIRVYSHESTDDSDEILARLAGLGVAEWTPWTVAPGLKPQWVAYEDGLERLRDRVDWIAFIDLDEFIVLPRHASIQAFLEEYGAYEAIAINWKMFGSSGHVKHESGLVIERFTRCSNRDFRGNRAVKTLARADAIERPQHHTCHFREGVRYCTATGEEVPHFGDVASKEITHDIIRINHYFTRSREEWDEKVRRGRGAKPEDHPKKHRTPREFEAHDRNECEETEIVRFVPRVRAAIETYRQPVGAGGRQLA